MIYRIITGNTEFSVAVATGEILLASNDSWAYYRGSTEPINPRNGDRWDKVDVNNLLLDIKEYRNGNWYSIIPLLSGAYNPTVDLDGGYF